MRNAKIIFSFLTYFIKIKSVLFGTLPSLPTCHFPELFRGVWRYALNIKSIVMKKKKSTIWMVIGVLVLIALLLLWLTDAISVGDTDVNAPLAFLGNYVNIA